MQLYFKSLQNCYKKKLQPKTFSGSYQRNRKPSAKRLRQTPFYRSRLRASLVIESFLLKLKTITTCFEQDIFHNNLKDNVYGQIYYQKYSQLVPKYEFITDFFVGIISSTKNFNKLLLVESFFNITQEKEISQKGNNVLKFCKLHKIFAKLSLFL